MIMGERVKTPFITSTWRIIQFSKWFITILNFRPVNRLVGPPFQVAFHSLAEVHGDDPNDPYPILQERVDA